MWRITWVFLTVALVACGALLGTDEDADEVGSAPDAGGADSSPTTPDAESGGGGDGGTEAATSTGSCVPGTECEGGVCMPNAACEAPRDIDASCTASWQCASNLCDPDAGRCASDASVACTSTFYAFCNESAGGRPCCAGYRCESLMFEEHRCDFCNVGGVPCDSGAHPCCSDVCLGNGTCM